MKSLTIIAGVGAALALTTGAALAVNADIFHPQIFADWGLPVADKILGGGLWLAAGPGAGYQAFRSLSKLSQELNDAQHPGDYSHKAATGTITTALVASSAAIFTFFGVPALKAAGLTAHVLATAPVIHHLVR